MEGANIFVIYSDSSGSNVTLSPRLGKGEVEPNFDTDAQVSLLDGTGIANGVMTANVKCTYRSGYSSKLSFLSEYNI